MASGDSGTHCNASMGIISSWLILVTLDIKIDIDIGIQNQSFGSASKLKEVSFFQKMKNEITLKGETLSQLECKLAPQDIVLNCSDGQV